MGCDIEIFGIQPDLKMQEKCILFCDALSAKAPLPPSKYAIAENWTPSCPEDESPVYGIPDNSSEEFAQGPGTQIKSISDPDIPEEIRRMVYDDWEEIWEREADEKYRKHQEEIRGKIEPEDIVTRYSNIIFVGAPIDQQIIRDYPGKSVWKPTLFSRIFSLPFTGFHCLFDREKGGVICSPYEPASICRPDEGYEKRNGHQYWLGASNRISAGNSNPYVVAHAVKRHFIPNLIFNADYDQELFDQIIREIGLEDKIDRANSSTLVDVVYNGLIDTRDAYHERFN